MDAPCAWREIPSAPSVNWHRSATPGTRRSDRPLTENSKRSQPTMSKNKVVLITGASTAFGREPAETVARRGYPVMATMRDLSGRNASHRDELQALSTREGLA